ncbi:MAG: adenylate/guanylate cyclase domain-containing protein [Alsobacter sp.]
MSHLDLDWGIPLRALFFERLGSFCRVTKFDKRGTGLSDRPTRAATLEERTDDIRAVMDAAGIDRASIFGQSEGGSLALMFAAMYPSRVRSVMLWGTQARWSKSVDHPWGMTDAEFEVMFQSIRDGWPSDFYIRGPGAGIGYDVDQSLVDGVARYMQAAASPSAVEAFERMNKEIDVRGILPAIETPTLVMIRDGDPVANVEAARDMAARLPNALFKNFPGVSHNIMRGDMDVVLAEMQRFLTGEVFDHTSERKLAVILFIDVASSTDRLVKDGDRAWSHLLNAYYNVVRKELTRYRGKEYNVAGDGFLALFDGPARAVRCALAIVSGVKQLGIDVRAGINVGECELIKDDVTGIAVHSAARVMSSATPGQVLVTQTVKDLVSGSGLRFTDQGEHILRGVPGKHQLYSASEET